MVNVSGVPQYLAVSQRLLMTDIIAYLENASDKEAGIDTLIGQMQFYQDQGSMIKSQLFDIIQKQTLENTSCTNNKELADKDFYQ